MFLERHTLETPEHVAVEFEVAGPMSRYAAALFDGIVLLIVFSLGGLAALLLGLVLQLSPEARDVYSGALLVGGALVIFGYWPLFEYFRDGQTPGKKALGIRVMRRDMAPLDFGAVFLRNVVRFVDFLPGLPFPLVGMIAMTVSERALRVGDMAAGTWVVRDPDAEPVRDRKFLTFRKEKPAGKAVVPAPDAGGGGRLTSAEYGLAKEFLERRSQLEPAARRPAALRIASPILRRLGEQALDADRFLAEEVRRGPAGKSLL